MMISDRAVSIRVPVGSGAGKRESWMRGQLPALVALLLPWMMIMPAAALAQTSTTFCVASADSMPAIPSGSSDFGVSDVTVSCSGGNAGESVYFNLRIDLSAPISGLTASIQTAAGSYQAFRPSANSLNWQAVVLPPPGASGLRTFRISGVRINAAQAAPGTVLMLFEISGTPAIALSNLTISVGNVAAPAWPATCSISAADPPQIPASNTDAAVAEITIQCTGGQAGVPVAISFQVYLTASVASQTATLTTDAGSSVGSRVGSNSVAWPPVVVTQPSPGSVVTLRMAGIRVNASTSAGGPLMGYVTASSPSSVVMASSQAVVGHVAGASPSLQINSVIPVTPLATGLRTITFTGGNFSAGLTVNINRPDGTPMPAASVTLVSLTAASLSVNVDFGGIAGNYQVSVRNPDGQVSPAFSFSVLLDPGPAARVGAVAHFASGGGWKTTIRLLNLGGVPATVRLTLTGGDGTPAQLPLVITQGGVSASMSGAVVDRTIPSNGSLQVESEAAFSATTVGWIEIRGSSPVTGFAVFRQKHEGGAESEGTSPLDSRVSQNVVLPFDNQSGYSTGAAIANLSSASPATVTAICRDDLGREFYRDAFVVPANGHISFALPQRWPSLAGRSGAVEFQSSLSSGIAALGFRFNPSMNFTSLPVSVPEPAR